MTEKYIGKKYDNWLYEFINKSLTARSAIVWISNDQFGVNTRKLYTIKGKLYNDLATDNKKSIGFDIKVKIFRLPLYMSYSLIHEN